MNYSGIIKADLANGTGVRVTLFVSGCDLHCHNCHSPELWDYNHGAVFDKQAEEKLLSYLDHDWISGLTISGGHPLDPENIKDVYRLLSKVRERFPEKNIWLYTGYILTPVDFVYRDESILCRTIALCDVIVDGPYIDELRDTTIAFRGSTNQRIIDVKRSIEGTRIAKLKTE